MKIHEIQIGEKIYRKDFRLYDFFIPRYIGKEFMIGDSFFKSEPGSHTESFYRLQDDKWFPYIGVKSTLLTDHEIALLINKLRDAVEKIFEDRITDRGRVRTRIHDVVAGYFNEL